MYVLFTLCLHMNRKAYGACNFNCFQNERRLKVTRSHLCSKCRSISETVQDSRFYYRPLTGSDLSIYDLANSENSDDLE